MSNHPFPKNALILGELIAPTLLNVWILLLLSSWQCVVDVITGASRTDVSVMVFLHSQTFSTENFSHIFRFNTTCFGFCPVHMWYSIESKQSKGKVKSQDIAIVFLLRPTSPFVCCLTELNALAPHLIVSCILIGCLVWCKSVLLQKETLIDWCPRAWWSFT